MEIFERVNLVDASHEINTNKLDLKQIEDVHLITINMLTCQHVNIEDVYLINYQQVNMLTTCYMSQTN